MVQGLNIGSFGITVPEPEIDILMNLAAEFHPELLKPEF
jgi:hypothetical protein